MSMKKWSKGLVILLALILVMTTTGSLGVFAAQPMETVNTLKVELNDDFFNPKVISIPNEKTTTLILKNVGQREHTFTVKELGIDAEVQPGQEKTITVTPKKPGTYELICQYHFREGMVGQVIVK
ncbi:cupredoxin domain-containing protein [Neobacillus niacini]|jgi:plastocyanin|uniref:cupredoxin domain-containing protein n=1 Tax=Neobacillus niacini TaxID=86668 RepID=UPI001C8DD330|nr:cupredoxin domain-containing protein [Neobacillus niacini]MBY0148749.1 cupredoxin domain-containing protein [Neobacillus niacini]